MKRSIQIAPSILAADFSRLGDEVRKVIEAGADLIHIDIMDGHFVPNLTMGPNIVKSIRDQTDLPFDVHLMTTHPHEQIEMFADAGADLITFHVEVNSATILETIEKIRSKNLKVGLAIRPSTPIEKVVPFLSEIDLVLPMSVEPGFGGQSFIFETLDKITFVKEKLSNVSNSVEIEVDGGINAKTAPLVIDRGATIIVAGTAIFRQNDYAQAIRNLRGAE